MSKVISVNAGSSSLKFQLFDMPSETVLTSGIAERIGLEMGAFSIKVNGEKHEKQLPIPDHKVAVSLLLEALIEYKVVDSLDEISAAGHRIVQGGSYFAGSVKVDEDVVNKVSELAPLAPLHNPAHLIGYRAFKEALPQIEHVFVFDTAFHQTMEEDSYLFPVPYQWYTDHKVRRYGAHGTSHDSQIEHVFVFDTAFHQTMEEDSYLFPVPYQWYTDHKVRRYGAHGTSHDYVSHHAAELMGVDIKDTKIITCHLGNGASISAVDGGKCVNTSMGLTPLGGIMMGTRCGDIDPSVVVFMMKELNCTPEEMDNYLNKKSGMLGVSGISSDARDIADAIAKGDENAIRTMKLYVNRCVNVIGGYVAQMGGCDAIVFTAGLGENDIDLRQQILDRLTPTLHVVCDPVRNNVRGKDTLISTDDSKVKAYVIPTLEELMIARDTYRILGLN